MRQVARLGVTLALAGLLGACQLVDQKSFGKAPAPPPADALASSFASGSREPLLVVRPADRVPYGEALQTAVAAAEARDGNGRFRLVGVVPAEGDAVAQAAAMDRNAGAVREVLDAMGEDGISPERVTLQARAEPAVTVAEVRLFAGGN